MTSIEWLFNELWETSKDKLTWHSVLNKAKEMHNQEITTAFDEGQEHDLNLYRYKGSSKFYAEQYYQETFKKN